MAPIDYLGMSRSELYDEVNGGVWRGWTAQEPVLREIDGLQALWPLRGRRADGFLGALVRLAAQDGGDDRLASVAVAHQLATASRRLAMSLRDLSSDVDQVVASTLWLHTKTFPWRDRTRGYATSLIWSTRASVLESFLPARARKGSQHEVVIDPLSPTVPWNLCADYQAESANAADRSHRDFVDLLEWALSSGVVSHADVKLVVDLIAAGERVAPVETPHMRQGMCSQSAVLLVAGERGISGKTVMRQRDRVISALRQAAPAYLREVA